MARLRWSWWHRFGPSYWLQPEAGGAAGHLWARWLFLRLLGLIFLSAFVSLVVSINGLIGPRGLLPAGAYLAALPAHFGLSRYWFAPTLLWLGSGHWEPQALCWAGMAASALLTLNRWPRVAIAAAEVLFLSFVAAARDFSNYQSDGMLLAAGLIAWFFAPPGGAPGLGEDRAPTPASLFLLQWLWLRIYFESGLAKWLGGDPRWRHLTALQGYYQNNPLPTWIGYFLRLLPGNWQAGLALGTLVLELGLVWLLFLPRRIRLALFLLATAFQFGLALTANYAFINWITAGLGLLLLDDGYLGPALRWLRRGGLAGAQAAARHHGTGRRWLEGLMLGWVFYATLALLLWMPWPRLPLPSPPVTLLEPFRVANQYGLFGRMVRGRHEIEFQGSFDGVRWVAYPFRFKPQETNRAPGIFAPFQPRFDWNLWFAAQGGWRQTPWVVNCEADLLRGDPAVLALFASDPFAARPPRYVRAVLWQYWFTRPAELRRTGNWWRREFVGLFAPELERLAAAGRSEAGGKLVIVAWPQ